MTWWPCNLPGRAAAGRYPGSNRRHPLPPEEDPVAEAAALGALAVRFQHDVFPAHVIGRGKDLEYFQDVSQFRCQLPVRCCLRLAGLLEQLGARQQTFVRLEDLAVPYAAAICEHLEVEDRQSTSAQSKFLDACRSRNRGDLDAEQLAEVTARLGFANVVDAFHISRGGEPTQTRFFADERASRQGLTLTDHLLELANGLQATVLPREVDARWNLVQMSWGLRLGARLSASDAGTTLQRSNGEDPFVMDAARHQGRP